MIKLKEYLRKNHPQLYLPLREKKNYLIDLFFIKNIPEIGYYKIFNINFTMDGIFFISSPKGLFLIKNNKLIQLLKGNYFGITLRKNNVYVYNQKRGFGRLIKLYCKDIENIKIKIEITYLPYGCHQIDIVDDDILITNTYHNEIIFYNLEKERITKKQIINGELNNKRKSLNYAHCNSIFSKDNSIYFMFHNETTKTNKSSQIAKYSKDFKSIEIFEIKAGNAHNIYIKDNEFLFCNSNNNSLMIKNKEPFKCDYFTRGLSISDDIILVGGSEISSREKRKYSSGKVFVLNNQYKKLGEFQVPAPVHDIRRLDKKDECLSQFN